MALVKSYTKASIGGVDVAVEVTTDSTGHQPPVAVAYTLDKLQALIAGPQAEVARIQGMITLITPPVTPQA